MGGVATWDESPAAEEIYAEMVRAAEILARCPKVHPADAIVAIGELPLKGGGTCRGVMFGDGRFFEHDAAPEAPLFELETPIRGPMYGRIHYEVKL